MRPVPVVNRGGIGHRGRRSGHARGEDKLIVEVRGVKNPRHLQLPEIAHALDAIGLGLGLAERRQQHRSQNGDDGDDNQKLDQRKRSGM